MNKHIFQWEEDAVSEMADGNWQMRLSGAMCVWALVCCIVLAEWKLSYNPTVNLHNGRAAANKQHEKPNPAFQSNPTLRSYDYQILERTDECSQRQQENTVMQRSFISVRS